MPNPAISIQDLGKKYKIGLRDEIKRNFGEALLHALGTPLRQLRVLSEKSDGSDVFWALRNVSLEVQPGEVVGVIGPNGAGKSTLLKILSRITVPTTGRAEVRGNVRSLLEVGTGFHPELSGRENIYLNGAILGMKKAQIDRHFDEIVAFAEIDRFLDTPVKRYSSGMYVRLAFAVAAHLQPEILIVDEVLAVGDVGFQKKCLGTMQNVATSGRTVLFVSHNMAAISQLCSRVVVLRDGCVSYDGQTGEAIQRYLSLDEVIGSDANFPPEEQKPMQIASIKVESAASGAIGRVESADPCRINVGYVIRDWKPGAYVCVAVTNEAGLHVLWSSDTDQPSDLMAQREPGTYNATIEIPARTLPVGKYYVSVAICATHCQRAFDFRERPIAFEVIDNQALLSRFGIRFPAVTAIPLAWSTRYVGSLVHDGV